MVRHFTLNTYIFIEKLSKAKSVLTSCGDHHVWFTIPGFCVPWAAQRKDVSSIPLTLASDVEVGCPGTCRLGLPTPNPGSKSTPKACPTRNPVTSPACHTQPQPKHLSHRARSSVEIIITVITNKSNNNKDNNNNMVIIIKGRGGWDKTLKHSKNWSRCPKH